MKSYALALSAVAGVSLAVAPAQAQSDEVRVDLSNIRLRNPFNDQSRDSLNNPSTGSDTLINLAEGYSFTIEGQIDVDLFGIDFFPSGPGTTDLGELLNFIEAGQSRLLTGFVRTPGGIPPGGRIVWREGFNGDFNGIQFNINLQIQIADTGVVTLTILDISIPALARPFFVIDFDIGEATVAVWEPSEPQLSEWHFGGDLEADERSAGSTLRYLDDDAFGPILGGLNDPTALPAQPTPFDVTEAQSSFVDTATTPGLDGPGGEDDVVYLTSPAFNTSDQNNSDLRRGIGLSLAPALMPEYPGSFVGAYTLVWDLNIPSSSWFNSSGQPRGILLALSQDDADNDDGADLWIRNDGGQPSIVYALDGDNFNDMRLNLPASVAPDTWFRLAVVVDEFQAARSEVYVNGSPVGQIKSNWINSSVDAGDPFFTDGEPVDPADWAAWGMHPSSWARSSATEPAALNSTVCLFSDLRFGGSQPAYVANLAFVDRLVSSAEIADLGGPSADGIFLLQSDMNPGCSVADLAMPFNALDIADVVAFLQLFGAMDPAADLSPPFGAFDIADVVGFLQVFGAGCP